MSLLEKISVGKRQQPPRLLIYGSEGSGKSTFASCAPQPIFVLTEDGTDQLDCHSFPLCRSFEDCMAYITALSTEEHDYQTIVIDTVDWLERLIFDHLCDHYKVNSIEKVDGGYGKGYVHALAYWRQVIDGLRYLREERGMIVILIAHAKIESYIDPESTAFDRFSPKLHKHTNALLCEWCDAVLLTTRERGAAKGEKSGGERVLRCVSSPSCVAKNRYNLPEMLPLDWSALMTALTANV